MDLMYSDQHTVAVLHACKKDFPCVQKWVHALSVRGCKNLHILRQMTNSVKPECFYAGMYFAFFLDKKKKAVKN